MPTRARHGPLKTTKTSPLKPCGAIRKYPRIALFGDNHFQDRGLARIVRTGEWIADEIEKREVDAVVCLGDVLNTREQVSVRALSAALSFFDSLSKTLPDTPIHILLGNHDINLKHSRKFSSLDALSMEAMTNSGLVLHRELATLSSFLPGVPAIMIPYHEDPADIIDYLDKYSRKNGSVGETLVFGHLAVAGAQQNHSPYRYRGPLKTSYFSPFKRTFSGHFHHHHELARHKIVYVGSPIQFNFGDAGDTRGIVIYDTDTDTYELVPNPYGEAFVRESDDHLATRITDLLNQPELSHLKPSSGSQVVINSDSVPDNPFKDKFIQIQIESSDLSSTSFDTLRDSLLSLGASGVSKTTGALQTLIKEHKMEKNDSERRIIKHFGAVTAEDIERIIVSFANSVRKAHLESIAALREATANDSSSSGDLTSTSADSTGSSKSKKSRSKKNPAPSADSSASTETPGAKLGGRRRSTLIQQASVHFLEDDELFSKLVALGVSLASKSSTASATVPSSNATFSARLHSLYLKNFMGVKGELTIPFFSMNSGIWLIEGSNGAGKSTIFEALVWAQFGEFLRSGMQKDYAINDNAHSCTVRLIYENGLVIERKRKRRTNESLRTYQLKKATADGLGELDEEAAAKEAERKEDFEESTILLDREPSDLVEPAEPLTSSDTSSTSKKKKSRASASKSSTKGGGKVKKSGVGELVYEAESELGDIRNTQKQLSDRLGVNFETFTKSVVLGQNILNNFVSGNKDMRRAIIEEMLGLEKFGDWFEVAKQERARLDEKLKLLQQKKTLLQDELDTMNTSTGTRATLLEAKKQQLEQISEQRAQIEKVCAARITELESDLGLSRSKLQSPEMQEIVMELAAQESSEMQSEDVPRFTDELSKLASFQSSIRDILRHLKAAFTTDLSENGLGATCASCGQEVTTDHIEAIILRARKCEVKAQAFVPSRFFSEAQESKFANAEVSGSSAPLPTPEAAYADLNSLLSSTIAYADDILRRAQLMDSVRKIELSIARLETSLAQAQVLGAEELADVEKLCAACEAELEQLKAMRAEQSETERVLSQHIEEAASDISQTNVELSMTKFWEMAFDKQSKGTVGTVRAFVFEDVVKELNAICSGYMEQLQTKQQYHLKVSLTADLEMEQVYGKRSGGERKRTDLAILFAMFELVRSQSRFVPDFLMLDEVFDTLDQDGRDLVGQVLSSLSKRLEKILVITHTDVASGLSVAGVLDVAMPYDPMGNPTGTEIDVSHR